MAAAAIYGSDMGVAGYRDREFGVSLAWDADLLSGYDSHFLTRGNGHGQSSSDEIRARGAGELLRKLKPQAVMLVGYGSRFDREAVFVASRTGLPLLFRGETTDHSVSRTTARAWMRDTALRGFYGRLQRVLYIGQRSLEHYRRLGVPETKLTFAPYCVETTPFAGDEAARQQLRGPARQELGVSEADLVFLFAGKISERKGPDLLVRAVKQLPEALRARVCLCFMGDGQMKAEIASAAAETPAVRVVFLGFQNQTRLSRYYHAADLLVLPSRRGETWGLVVNEALHHGVPCVVSEAVGCALDLIRTGITGHTFETDSAGSLAEALNASTTALAGNVDTRDRCRQHVNGYSVSAAARGIAEAYRQVVHD